MPVPTDKQISTRGEVAHEALRVLLNGVPLPRSQIVRSDGSEEQNVELDINVWQFKFLDGLEEAGLIRSYGSRNGKRYVLNESSTDEVKDIINDYENGGRKIYSFLVGWSSNVPDYESESKYQESDAPLQLPAPRPEQDPMEAFALNIVYIRDQLREIKSFLDMEKFAENLAEAIRKPVRDGADSVTLNVFSELGDKTEKILNSIKSQPGVVVDAIYPHVKSQTERFNLVEESVKKLSSDVQEMKSMVARMEGLMNSSGKLPELMKKIDSHIADGQAIQEMCMSIMEKNDASN